MAHIHEQLERAHSICLASHQRIIAAIEFPLAAHELLCSPHIFVREVKEFVGDFNEFFEELKLWTEDAVQIKTRREFFEKRIPRCSAILLRVKWILMLTPQWRLNLP